VERRAPHRHISRAILQIVSHCFSASLADLKAKADWTKAELQIMSHVVGTCKSFRRASIGLDACPTGKSVTRLFLACPAPFEKIFWFSEYANQFICFAVLFPQEGRFAVVTDVGSGMRWTRRCHARESVRTNDAEADGEDVWSWCPDAGIKSAEAILPMTVANKPITGESTE
jgi:hypothetical protein